MSELKDLEQKYGELKDKYDEILQLQREQTSLTNRIITNIERLQEEINRLRGR